MTASIALAGCDSDYRVAGKELPINQLLTVALQQASHQTREAIDLPAGVRKIDCYVPGQKLYCDVYVDPTYATVNENPLPWTTRFEVPGRFLTMEAPTPMKWTRSDGSTHEVDGALLRDTEFTYVIERRADHALQVRASIDPDRVPFQEAQAVVIKGLALLNADLSRPLADAHANMTATVRETWKQPPRQVSNPDVPDEAAPGLTDRAAASAAGDGSGAEARR
ncbi:hypothetical protein WT02_20910 [Burkholderia stagnalis]|nr:hypothetical protein WT03_29530 [Burkholderia stagnalis]KVL91985.1 hypothetical protein WT02_20910 [Burkholderia stagnalis]KVM06124.1 hypothetical protein WT04_24805 [Burkholderia stagnalis]KVM89641.1 hypothetical protein WT05_03940 [Burkholderia stagnalis]